MLIYHLVFVIRVYASNVTGGSDLQSADPQANGEESTIELQLSYSRKYDPKKKETEKRSREKARGVWNLPAWHAVKPALDKIMLFK